MIWEETQNAILGDEEEENQPRMTLEEEEEENQCQGRKRDIEWIINRSCTVIERKKF